MTMADAVYSSHVACWNGSRNSRRSSSPVSTFSAPSAAVKSSIARVSWASDSPGGNGRVETTSAWLMTLSSSVRAEHYYSTRVNQVTTIGSSSVSRQPGSPSSRATSSRQLS